jgi:hypothetical protein
MPGNGVKFYEPSCKIKTSRLLVGRSISFGSFPKGSLILVFIRIGPLLQKRANSNQRVRINGIGGYG